MDEEIEFGGKQTTKAQAVASVTNSLIDEVINHCHRQRGIGDYFDVAIVGYGGEESTQLMGADFMTISQLHKMETPLSTETIPMRLPNGEVVECSVKRRCWIAPRSKGQTPMGDALRTAKRLAQSWCRLNPNSFPPLVINITDGEATDATSEQLLDLAEQLKATSTNDGNTLLFNIHICAEHDTPSSVLQFPSTSDPLPDTPYTQLLWKMASPLPAVFDSSIIELRGHAVAPPFRAVCYNCSANQLPALLNIGTISIEQMI